MTDLDKDSCRPSTVRRLRLCVRCDEVRVCTVRDAVLGLNGKHVVTPPRTSSPPQSTSPDIGILSHEGEHVLNSSFAIGVDGTCKFTDQSDLLIITEPDCCCLETLAANGLGDTGRGCTGAVLIGVVSLRTVLGHGKHTESRYWCIW